MEGAGWTPCGSRQFQLQSTRVYHPHGCPARCRHSIAQDSQAPVSIKTWWGKAGHSVQICCLQPIFSESSVNWSGERLVSVPAWSPEMWTGNLTLFGDQFGKGDKVERLIENMTPEFTTRPPGI